MNGLIPKLFSKVTLVHTAQEFLRHKLIRSVLFFRYSPLGVASLIAASILNVGDMQTAFSSLTLFFRYSPLGVASLIAASILNVGDMQAAFSSLALFILVNIMGFACHQLIILPLLYFAVVRKNPFKVQWNVFESVLMGFAPPSR